MPRAANAPPATQRVPGEPVDEILEAKKRVQAAMHPAAAVAVGDGEGAAQEKQVTKKKKKKAVAVAMDEDEADAEPAEPGPEPEPEAEAGAEAEAEADEEMHVVVQKKKKSKRPTKVLKSLKSRARPGSTVLGSGAIAGVGGTLKKKRKHRYRPGTVAAREVRREQKTAHKKPALPFLSFARVVREVAQNFKNDLRWQPDAIMALREAFEAYMIPEYTAALEFTKNSKRVTLYAKDMQALRRTREIQRMLPVGLSAQHDKSG